MKDVALEKAYKIDAVLKNPLAVRGVNLETNNNGTRVTKIQAKLKDKSKSETIMKIFQSNLGCNRGCASNSGVSIDKNKGLVVIDGTKMRDKLVFNLVVGLICEELDKFGKMSKCESSGKKSKCDSSDFPEDIPPEALFLIIGAIEEMEKTSKKV